MGIMSGILWTLTMDIAVQTVNITTMLHQKDGVVLLIIQHVNIGYMLDGGKLYGYCEIDGVPVTSCYVQNSASTPTNEVDYDYTPGDGCHLDECSMMEINGEMAYVLTPEFPQTPMCLKGNVASYYGFTP